MPRSKRTGKYRSKLEQRVAELLKTNGYRFKYESETFEYEIRVPNKRSFCAHCGSTDLLSTKRYTPDFFLDDGRILEVKGRFTAADRRKMEAVIKQYPHKKFIMVFQRDNRLHKGSNTLYSTWCESKKIQYAFVDSLAQALQK